MTTLAFDPGYGAIKLYGSHGGFAMQSLASIAAGKTVRRMAGLHVANPPLRIEGKNGVFYVGEGAHDWGRPVENLDFDRLTGSPEMLALFSGALTKYAIKEEIDLIVGLPIASLTGDTAQQTQKSVVEFLRGNHEWTAGRQSCATSVRSVRVTSQPVGAMFDYLLNDSGEMTADKHLAFKKEIGILSLGMNTVELLVVRDGSPVQRFTAGEKLGVRRLLELQNADSIYSLGEMDSQLRSGALDLSNTIPVWQSELLGFLEKSWGNSLRRFDTVVIVGGGVMILREALLARFRGRAQIPDDPIISTARGMYKYMLMRERRDK
jgi:hypothetical protein